MRLTLLLILTLLACLVSLAHADDVVSTPDAAPVIQAAPDGRLPGQGENLTPPQPTPDVRYERRLRRCANIALWGTIADGVTTTYALTHGGTELNMLSRMPADLMAPSVTGRERTQGLLVSALAFAVPPAKGGVLLFKIFQGIRYKRMLLRTRPHTPEISAAVSVAPAIWNTVQLAPVLEGRWK